MAGNGHHLLAGLENLLVKAWRDSCDDSWARPEVEEAVFPRRTGKDP